MEDKPLLSYHDVIIKVKLPHNIQKIPFPGQPQTNNPATTFNILLKDTLVKLLSANGGLKMGPLAGGCSLTARQACQNNNGKSGTEGLPAPCLRCIHDARACIQHKQIKRKSTPLQQKPQTTFDQHSPASSHCPC